MQAASKSVVGVIILTIALEPVIWLINKYLDDHPDVIGSFLTNLLETIFAYIPDGFFPGISVGAIFAYILLHGWKGPDRSSLIARWRNMANRAHQEFIEIRKLDPKFNDDSELLQKQPEYEEFTRVFHDQIERDMNRIGFRVRKICNKLRGKPPPHPLKSAPRSGLEWMTLGPMGRHTMMQIAWLERRWGLHKKWR